MLTIGIKQQQKTLIIPDFLSFVHNITLLGNVKYHEFCIIHMNDEIC